MPLTPEPFLITGVTGFIGRRLACHLAASGGRVVGLTRDADPGRCADLLAAGVELRTHDGSLEGIGAALAGLAPGVCFHLATQFVGVHRPEQVASLVDANVRFGAVLCEVLSRGGPVRFVHASTFWQHFEGRDYSPMSLYAATKQAFSSVLQYYVECRSFRAVDLALTDTYGPGDPRGKLVSVLVRAARSGERLALSAGEQWIDLLHVRDVVRALVCAGERSTETDGMATYGVSSGRPMRLREVASLVGSVAGREIAAEWGRLPYRQREMMAPWSVTPALPGWTPTIPLEQGVAELLALDA